MSKNNIRTRGLDAPWTNARPEAESRHQDAGLDAPRR